MKYFIDFEASEAEQKIISIGAVSEDGREFYSLVHTDDPITDRIVEITGLTQEEIDGAPDVNDVFSKLYDWCSINDDFPEFVNYGDSDYNFIENTFYDTSNMKAASMLSYLYLGMEDYSLRVKEMFYVNKTISLAKLGKHYREDMEEQNHNALDDAKLLKMVYENLEKNGKDSFIFKEYLDIRKTPSVGGKVLRINGDNVLEEYENIEEAVKWIKAQPNDKDAKYLSNADEKIRKAAHEGTRYFGYGWRII